VGLAAGAAMALANPNPAATAAAIAMVHDFSFRESQCPSEAVWAVRQE